MNEYSTKKTKALAKKTERKSVGIITWLKKQIITILLSVCMIIGFALIIYPSLSDYWNSIHQARAVMAYVESISNTNVEEYKEILKSAHEYNDNLAAAGIDWEQTFNKNKSYRSQLNLDGSGVMGYIRIQKIDITLPIYHGTDEKTLQTSIGHLEQSSLPVGGSSSHCMLSGHRGLPSARLFTDLDKLKEGDTFTLTILNETLTYEVDHIWIVKPSDLSHLTIEEGKDYCTLITCTPYGINSHRLLVRGHRIDNLNGDALVVADAIQIRPIYIAPFISLPILGIMLLYILIITSINNKNKRSVKDMYLEKKGLQETDLDIEEQDTIIELIKSVLIERS